MNPPDILRRMTVDARASGEPYLQSTMKKASESPLRHVRKKLVFQITASEGAAKQIMTRGMKLDDERIPLIRKKQDAYLYRDSDHAVFLTFAFSKGGQSYSIPEPDPIVMHYDMAYVHWRQARVCLSPMLEQLKTYQFNEDICNGLFQYFGPAMSFSTSLFIAMEATLNRSIPDTFEYVEEESQRTVSRNKSQIQQYVSFNDKVKKVLKAAIQKDFSKAHPTVWNRLAVLKEIRDMVVHPKPDSDDIKYRVLFTHLLRLDFEQQLRDVKQFINYYFDTDLIEECACGKTELD